MHDIKCERLSSDYSHTHAPTHTRSLTHYPCFRAHRSALFIGECLLACWLKLEREQVCWCQVDYILAIFQ